MKRKNKELVEALSRMLVIAQDRLKSAKEKDKRWDISHYRKDVRIIKAQLWDLA